MDVGQPEGLDSRIAVAQAVMPDDEGSEAAASDEVAPGGPSRQSEEAADGDEVLPDGPGGRPGEGEDVPYLLELYKFAVEMADRISARRATSNSFFLAVNAALTAFIGIIDAGGSTSKAGAASREDVFGETAITLVGIVFSIAWWLMLRSYRDLSRAKWNVITRLEDRLDIRLYQDEWKILKAEEPTTWRRRYRELGLVERVVPLLFLAVYIAFTLRILA